MSKVCAHRDRQLRRPILGHSLFQAASAEAHEAHLVSSPQRAWSAQGQDGCPLSADTELRRSLRAQVPPTEPLPTEPPLSSPGEGALAGARLLQC